jgi:hypothetical protein
MTVRVSVFYPFAVKDWLIIRREHSAVTIAATLIMAAVVFIAVAGAPRAAALQLLYLLPGVVTGNLFTNWIQREVQALLVLRLVLRNMLEFFYAKFLVMLISTSALAIAIAVALEVALLRDSAGLAAVRLGLIAFGCVAQCALCLGIGCSFTDLEESASERRTTAAAWVHGAYWLSVPPVAGMLWLLERSLVPAGVSIPLLAVQLGAAVLVTLVAASALALLAIGARRLSVFE